MRTVNVSGRRSLRHPAGWNLSAGGPCATPVLGICLLLGGLVHAAEPTVPALSCAAPEHDFGRIQGGQRARHEFVLTNQGREPVEMTSVKSSCGCLEVGEWARHLEPGVSSAIPLVLDTANYSGPVSERVTVTTASPGEPPLVLRIEATVWWPVEVTPRAARFEFGANSGTNAHRVVRVVNQEESPLHLGPPESSSRTLIATLRTNVPGKEFELTIRIVPPLPRGNLFGQVKLPTSSTHMPVLEIPVFALLQPDLVVSPAQLTLSTGELREPVRRQVLVRSYWTNALELSAATFPDPGVVVSVKPVQADFSHEVELTFSAGFRPSPNQQLELRLETNHPRYRVLRVPVRFSGG